MENLITFTLFGSAIWFTIVSLVLIIIYFISEIAEDGSYGFVATLIFIALYYFSGDGKLLNLVFTLQNIILYVTIGFIFSLIRTYFKGRELTKEDRKSFKLKEHVFRWWFLFPFAIINWVCGKILKDLWNLIYSKTSKLYESLFNISGNDKDDV